MWALMVNDGWSVTGLFPGDSGVTVRLVLLAVVVVALYMREGWKDGYTLTLVVLLLVSLYQYNSIKGRMVADGFSYYAYVQSLWKDFDVNFENEYRMYGMLDRPSLETPTRTGHRRNIFSIGPALFWSPFYLLGEAQARLAAWSGETVNLKGNGPFHWNSVGLASLFYGFAAVLLIQSLLRRYFDRTTAFAGAVLTWLGTSLHWYMVYQPWMAHAVATFTAAAFLWFWDRGRLRSGWRDAFILGLAGGLMVSVRWQNGILLFLPLFDWLWALWRDRDRALFLAGPILFGGFLLGLLPQLLAWKAIFGQYLFLHPPHGVNYVRYSRPFVLETLFSSRHGLLSWTPIIWLGYLGLLPLLKKRWTTVWMMTFCVLLMTYVNMCVLDWWGNNSFSNRRFDAALPIFAFGIAASFEILRRFVTKRPVWALGAFLAFFPLWNVLFMAQYGRHRIPIDHPVSFTEVASNSSEILFDKVGYPFSWPVNWWFAWKYDASPAKYDTVVGRYFFYVHRYPSETMEIGLDDGGLIGEGWNRPELRVGRWVRVTRRKRARLFVPLERSDVLRLSFQIAVRPHPVDVIVKVNEEEVGRFRASPPGYKDYLVRMPVRFRKGVNTLDLEPQFEEKGQILLLDRVTFDRVEP
jgi:hypothetical protein